MATPPESPGIRTLTASEMFALDLNATALAEESSSLAYFKMGAMTEPGRAWGEIDSAALDGETYWDRVHDAINAAGDASRPPAERVTWLTTAGERTAAIVPTIAAKDYLDNPPVTFGEAARIQRESR